MTIDDILKSKEWQLEEIRDKRFPYMIVLEFGLDRFRYGIPPYTVDFSNLCPDCKMVHDAATPHFPNVTWIGKFIRENWRLPHWCDLIKCCTPDVQERVREHLEMRGRWSVPREGLAEEEKIARELGDLLVHSTEANVKEVSRVAVESEIKKALNPFAGCPNDERMREAMADAVVGVMRKSAINDLGVDVSVDPVRPDQINVSAVFYPRFPVADVRELEIRVILQSSEEDSRD